MDAEHEAEYRQTLDEIARLKQQLLDIAEEAWVRAETYRHEVQG